MSRGFLLTPLIVLVGHDNDVQFSSGQTAVGVVDLPLPLPIH